MPDTRPAPNAIITRVPKPTRCLASIISPATTITPISKLSQFVSIAETKLLFRIVDVPLSTLYTLLYLGSWAQEVLTVEHIAVLGFSCRLFCNFHPCDAHFIHFLNLENVLPRLHAHPLRGRRDLTRH